MTWGRANEAAGQIRPWQLLLQNGNNLLIKVLHGHRGDIPQLLENLVSSLGGSGGVHVAQHTVNLIYHLITHRGTWNKTSRQHTRVSMGPLLASSEKFCQYLSNFSEIWLGNNKEDF